MSTRLGTFITNVGTVQLFVMDCSECGVIYGFASTYEARRREDGKSWRCPNGHPQAFRESESDQQRKRAEQAERRLKWAEARESAQRRERQAAERSARAYKGHLTRMRGRIANGVCPVSGCRRNFANVKAHITSQHPDWAHEHPEALS